MTSTVWALLVLLSMLWGGAFFFVGVAVVELPSLTSATCQLISSTLIMTVVVTNIERPWTLRMPSTEVWMALYILALFGTAVAYVVFFEILSHQCQQRNARHSADTRDGAATR